MKYLLKRGDVLLVRNVRTGHGELDLVTRRGELIVFVEVKTRRSDAFGSPEAAVTPAKQRNLIHSAQAFLLDHPELDGDWQIDVIAIRPSGGQDPEIVHIENAVTG